MNGKFSPSGVGESLPADSDFVTISKTELSALRDSERQLRTIFEEAAMGIRLGDPEGRAIRSNAALSRMLGYTAAELRMMSYTEITLPEDSAADVRFHEELFRGERNHYRREKRYVHKDGHTVWGSLTVSLVHDEDGKPQFIVGMVEDITERKRAQEALTQRDAELQQSQKMEAVGQLAGGIAHDFNNLLTVIHTYSDLVLSSMSLHDPARADIREIRQASERAAALTRQLLAFSRRQVLKPEVVGIVDVVSSLEHMLVRVLGEDIQLKSTATSHPETLRALVDRGQLEQILVNLALNARDAMPAGGDLTISVEHAADNAQFASAHPERAGGNYVAVRVSDTGTGMSDEILKRIFDPFFTTKPVGKGTGLGLAVVYGIVNQSGGFIDVASLPGQGTVFTVYLPQANGEIAVIPPTMSHAQVSTRTAEVILLVEDEPAVRAVTKRLLLGRGYTILTAGNGEEALEILERQDVHIDLILSDMVMPVMGGQELIERVATLRRLPRVLFMSGYSEDEMLRRRTFPQGITFLEKPFTSEALLDRVRTALL